MEGTDRKILSGVFAAVPTPVQSDGRPDWDGLGPLLDRICATGIAGICVGGATGEYPCFDVEERIRILRNAGEYLAGRLPMICGIGAESFPRSLRLARAAEEAKAAAVLMPPPSYFSYRSADLREMLHEAASQIQIPVVFYHIPQFTNALQPADAISLVQSAKSVVGIKDSSGQKDTLKRFADAKHETDFLLMVGSDELLLDGLGWGADGVISGTCSLAPELVAGLYGAFRNGDAQRAADMQKVLQTLVNAMAELPVPWAIKIALEAQGFSMGCCSWPAGSELQSRMARFRRRFEEWLPMMQTCLSARSASDT